MKPRDIIILAIIFVLLVCAVVYKQTQKPPELSTEEYAALDLSFDSAQLAGLEIVKGKDEKLVALVKTEGKWFVSNFSGARADQDKIDRLIKGIQEAKGEIRGKDKSLFKDFGMAEDEAYVLKLSDSGGKSLLDLSLGSKMPSYDTVFARKHGTDQVYLANVNLFSRMGLYDDPAKEKPTADFWCQLSLAEFKADDVERLEAKRFQDAKEIVTASIVREVDPYDSAKKKWNYVRAGVPFALDIEKLKQFLGSVPSWKASKAHDPKAKEFGFTKPRWQMKLGLSEGREIVLTAGNQDASTSSYYIQVSAEPVVFELGQYQVQNFDVDDSKFFVDNPLGVDPDNTEKLVIHADTKNLSFTPKQNKWDSLTHYLNEMKTLTVSRLLFAPEEQKKVTQGSKYWLEIQNSGQASQFLDVGSIVSEQDKLYAARKRDNTQAFAISEADFKKLFDNLDRLDSH